MIQKILLYEVHYLSFNRTLIPLAEYLILNKVAKSILLVYDDFVASKKIKKTKTRSIRQIPVKKAYRALLLQAKKSHNAEILFITYGYRIPDIYWTTRFKKQGVVCYQLQHGMYALFLKRTFFGYFSAMKRKIIYLRYLLYYLFQPHFGVFFYLLSKDFIKIDSINQYIGQKFCNTIAITHSDHLFVFGNFWKEQFIRNHFYASTDQFTTMGNPDYHKFFKEKNTVDATGKICYIAQTFVEDGRMYRSDYCRIISKLSKTFKEKFWVKMHPRSDVKLYQEVLDNGGALRQDFPMAGIFIGHYSSLLALAINTKAMVYLLKINKEEIPAYFADAVGKVHDNSDSLIAAIKGKQTANPKKDITYYFENKQEHPFQIVSKKIKQQFN